jgi:organic hydroperoxide reductase OsmC/OhrA
MSEYGAALSWERGDQDFLDNRYSRAHRLVFDGGAAVTASSSPLSVPVPMSDASAIDPEEMLVAAASSCHMLWFLAIAAKRRFRVDRYRDRPVGTMTKNALGKSFISMIRLRPAVEFSGDRIPTPEQLAALHEQAHAECYIAHSLKAEIVVE